MRPATAAFSPEKFIDREVEQEHFEQLLRFEDRSRLLTIEDAGGHGKSSLLRMLRYKCVWGAPQHSVSLVALNELEDPSPFALVSRLRSDFSEFGLDFERFDRMNQELRRKFGPLSAPPPVQASGRFESADVRGVAGGLVVSAPKAVHIGDINLAPAPPDWVRQQELLARQECINAFFDDVKTICAHQSLIVLFDAFERAAPELQDWIINSVLLMHCFDIANRPESFVVVLAGRSLPDFEQRLGTERFGLLVKSRKSLSSWTEEHVKDFLAVHGYPGLDNEEVHLIWKKIDEGRSLDWALRVVEQYMREEDD